VPRDALIIYGISHHLSVMEINDYLTDHALPLLTD
jgi:hypothetical protein